MSVWVNLDRDVSVGLISFSNHHFTSDTIVEMSLDMDSLAERLFGSSANRRSHEEKYDAEKTYVDEGTHSIFKHLSDHKE